MFSIVMEYMIYHYYVTCIDLDMYSQCNQKHTQYTFLNDYIVYPRSGTPFQPRRMMSNSIFHMFSIVIEYMIYQQVKQPVPSNILLLFILFCTLQESSTKSDQASEGWTLISIQALLQDWYLIRLPRNLMRSLAQVVLVQFFRTIKMEDHFVG